MHYREGLKLLGPLGTFLGSTEAVSLNVKLFASHVTLLPLLLVLLLAAHFYLVHVHNLSPLPFGTDSTLATLPPERMTGTFMEHTRSILLYAAIYYGLVGVLAWAVPAPLGASVTGEEMSIKPPWPFLWLYGIENLTGRMDTMMHAIAALLILLALAPLLDRGQERHPARRKGTMAVGAVVLLAIVGFSLYAAIAPPQIHHHEHMDMEMDMTDPAAMPPPEEPGHDDTGHPHSP
jgi:quinol-cytochrome oxidoreductase complex cytochrome b subunit